MAEITPKSVTQGKRYSSDKYAAAHAIDNDLSTFAATETGDGAGWMRIEFVKTYFVHKVVIYYVFYTNWYNPSDWCAQSEANFRKCVKGDNNVDVSVYQGDEKQKSCGTLQLTDGLEQSDQIYRLVCSIKGDTVFLSKETGEGLNLIQVAEVAVTTTGIYFVNFTTYIAVSAFLVNISERCNIAKIRVKFWKLVDLRPVYGLYTVLKGPLYGQYTARHVLCATCTRPTYGLYNAFTHPSLYGQTACIWHVCTGLP